MNILLDTHTFIWYFQGSEQISLKALETLEDPKILTIAYT